MSRQTHLILFQLLFITLLFVSVKCQKCESEKYVYPQNWICRNITGKFPYRSIFFNSVVCYDCTIPVVEEDTLTNFRGTTFNLSYSHVQNISSTAFKSFSSSTQSYLFEGNEISYIAPRIFSNFSNIYKLNFRNNKISYLPNDTFFGTITTELDLSGNQLTDISTSFAELTVAVLNLSSNEISTINDDTFGKITFWKGQRFRYNTIQVDLSYNFITTINPNAFKAKSRNTCLGNLFLKNNHISTIENNTFSQLPYLNLLTLEENYISELYMHSFKGLKELLTLNLRGNKIVNIPEGMFMDLQKLTTLDLSQNNLVSLTSTTFSGLSYLKNLNISHNNFKLLDNSQLVPLGKLNNLDISDTKLRKLNIAALLEHHYQLAVLVINDNFWICKDLAEMYKKMNKKIRGFSYASHHYDVPNLHGVACSRTELDSYNDITFEDFMSIISQDQVFEDLFDNRVSKEYTEDMLNVEDLNAAIKVLSSIFGLVLIITVLLILLVFQYIVRVIYALIFKRKNIADVSYSYSSYEDNVKFI